MHSRYNVKNTILNALPDTGSSCALQSGQQNRAALEGQCYGSPGDKKPSHLRHPSFYQNVPHSFVILQRRMLQSRPASGQSLRDPPCEEVSLRDDDLERVPLVSKENQEEQQRDGRAAGDAAGSGGLAHVFWHSDSACVLGSALCFAAAAALVKTVEALGPPSISVFEIVLVRALFSGAVTAGSCRLGGIPIFGHAAPLWLKVARGAIGATAMTAS